MYRERCRVLANGRVAPGHYVLRLGSARIARAAGPGRFVQVLCADSSEPLLGRPFSFLTARPGSFDLLYHVVGQGTRILQGLQKGDALWVLGPLGNGFGTKLGPGAEAALVGGGVGIPPLVHLAETLLKTRAVRPGKIRVFLGARDSTLLLCLKDFRKLGVDLRLATDDGSRGTKGFVTRPLERYLAEAAPAGTRTTVYTCGPTPMLKAVGALAERYGVPCQTSVEVPMACGFGACLGCAIKVNDAAGSSTDFRYAIACCEGPVFDAAALVWD